MALEVVKAFSLEHDRWLSPLQEYVLREVKGATVEGRKAEPEARRIYDPLTEVMREENRWILCNCLPHGSERPVIVLSQGQHGIRLGNRPNAPVPHDGNCIFRLRDFLARHLRVLLQSADARPAGRGFGGTRPGARTLEPGGPVRPVRRPRAQVLHPGGAAAYAGRSGAVSVSGGLARGTQTRRARVPRRAARSGVGVAVHRPRELALGRSPGNAGRSRAALAEGSPALRLPMLGRARRGGPRHQRQDQGRRPRGGDVSPWSLRSSTTRGWRGPISSWARWNSPQTGPGGSASWPMRSPSPRRKLPIPVESDYERQALLSLAQLVRDLRSDKELQEALGGAVGVELQKPLFPIRVHEGLCLPDVLLTVTRPGGPAPRVPDSPFDDSDKARYVLRGHGVRRREIRDEEGRNPPPDGAARPGDPPGGAAVRVRSLRPGAPAREDRLSDREGSHLAVGRNLTVPVPAAGPPAP